MNELKLAPIWWRLITINGRLRISGLVLCFLFCFSIGEFKLFCFIPLIFMIVISLIIRWLYLKANISLDQKEDYAKSWGYRLK